MKNKSALINYKFIVAILLIIIYIFLLNYVNSATPTVTNVIINSTLRQNTTFENITGSWTINQNGWANITVWYLNNNSIMTMYLPFENISNASLTHDYSGFNRYGDVYNANNCTNCGYDGFGAYRFDIDDGTNDYINVSNPIGSNISNGLTIVFWINASNKTFSSQYIMNTEHLGFNIFLEPNTTRVRFGFNKGTFYETAGEVGDYYLPNFEWHNIAVLVDWNINKTRLYDNGVEQWEEDITNTYFNGTIDDGNYLHIGRGYNPGITDNYFNGTLDDIRVYNRTLSDEQIKFIFENKTNMLSSEETNTNDIWHFSVNPVNASEKGAQVNSTWMQIYYSPNNNYVCSGYPYSCEYANITSALYGENNTANTIYLLDNNTEYGIQETTHFYFLDSLLRFNNLINVTFDCNMSIINLSTGIVNAVRLFNTINVTIRNCIFIQYTEPSITTLGNTIGLNITNNTFSNCEHGIGNEANLLSAYITKNNFSYCGKAIFMGAGGHMNNTIIENNYFIGEWGPGGVTEYIIGTGGNFTIRNNIIKSINHRIIEVGANEVYIYNNTIQDCNSTDGILYSDFSYVTIENNTFINISDTDTISISGVKNSTIRNNNFTENYRAIFSDTNGENISISENYFINSTIGIRTSGNSILSIKNNTFLYTFMGIHLNFGTENVSIINNTFNETGNNTFNYVADMIGVKNQTGIAFDDYIFFGTGALATIQTITANDTAIQPDILNGTTNFDLLLWQDTAGVIDTGANSTIWWNHDDGITCAVWTGTFGGDCVYENHAGVLYNGTSGAHPNYVFNDTNVTLHQGTPNADYGWYQTGFPIYLSGTINSNITGNSFYNENKNTSAIYNDATSANNMFWYNNFYGAGISTIAGTMAENTTGCYNSIGNFYDYRIPYDNMARGECGLVNITEINGINISDNSNATVQSSSFKLKWGIQDSYKNINYYVEYLPYGGNWEKVGVTNSTEILFNLDGKANGNYYINIIPMQNPNGTYRNISFHYDRLLTPAGASTGSTGGSVCGEGEYLNEGGICVKKSEDFLGSIKDKLMDLKNIRLIIAVIGAFLILWYWNKKNYAMVAIGALLIAIGALSNEDFIRKYLDLISPKIKGVMDRLIEIFKNINIKSILPHQ